MSCTKFLRLHVEFLKRDTNVNKSCLKLSNFGFEIKIVTQCMNADTIKILYHVNSESVISFGIIFVAQKTIIRTIYWIGFSISIFIFKNIYEFDNGETQL